MYMNMYIKICHCYICVYMSAHCKIKITGVTTEATKIKVTL